MKYKGYTGIVEFDEESQVLCGRVIGLRDVITFEGDSGPEVTQAFHDSVDDYLAFCAERGESPEKPYSGQFVLRLDPRLHRELANAAQEKDTSLNALIESVLSRDFLSQAEEGRPQASPVVTRVAEEQLAATGSSGGKKLPYKIRVSRPARKGSAIDTMVGQGAAKPRKNKKKK